MALSGKKKAALERKKREDYVKSCSFGNRTYVPFGEANWDDAAAKYIETGDEDLKDRFPKPRRSRD